MKFAAAQAAQKTAKTKAAMLMEFAAAQAAQKVIP